MFHFTLAPLRLTLKVAGLVLECAFGRDDSDRFAAGDVPGMTTGGLVVVAIDEDPEQAEAIAQALVDRFDSAFSQ